MPVLIVILTMKPVFWIVLMSNKRGYTLIELLVVMSFLLFLMHISIPIWKESYYAWKERKEIVKAGFVLLMAEKYCHLYGACPASVDDLRNRGLLPANFDVTGMVLTVHEGRGNIAELNQPCLWRNVALEVNVTQPWFQGYVTNINYNLATHTYTLARHLKLVQSRSDYRAKARGFCDLAWRP